LYIYFLLTSETCLTANFDADARLIKKSTQEFICINDCVGPIDSNATKSLSKIKHRNVFNGKIWCVS